MSILRNRLIKLSISGLFGTASENSSPLEDWHFPLTPSAPETPQKTAPVPSAENEQPAQPAPLVGASPQREAAADKPAPKEKKRRKYPPPISVRVTWEERERLEREAAGMSLSGHVRERLFKDKTVPRKTRGRFPVKDHAALAQVLAALGRSGLYNTLSRLLLAVEEGRCPLEHDLERDVREALQHVVVMRTELVTALGLKTHSPP